ncbi:MAG: TraR/DksA C4-type zinc finger protein [Candidatus Kerfeldbacteria bacterium]|nr:TraR/DksA C4-type zinc finger protein [Candidatus Kerfeldbacteria bacterium]
MDQAFINEMKQALEKEQQLLTEDLNSVSTPDVHNHTPGARVATFPNYGDDRLDSNSESPVEVQDYLESLDATGVLSTRVEQIQHALKKIEQGSYGVCEQCGQPMNEDRLRANSAATECMNCAKTHR